MVVMESISLVFYYLIFIGTDLTSGEVCSLIMRKAFRSPLGEQTVNVWAQLWVV